MRAWARLRVVVRCAGRALGQAGGVTVFPRATPADDRLAQLCAALHRLDAEIARLSHDDPRTPGLYHRLRSAMLAYDAVLVQTCHTVGVQVPGLTPAQDRLDVTDTLARLEAEAGLAAVGLTW